MYFYSALEGLYSQFLDFFGTKARVISGDLFRINPVLKGNQKFERLFFGSSVTESLYRFDPITAFYYYFFIKKTLDNFSLTPIQVGKSI